MKDNGELDKKPLVVIVDDNQTILDRFSSFLREDHGFEVLTAATQEAAVKCVEGISRPAVVLLDRFMVNEQGKVVLGEDILQILLERARYTIVSILHSDDDSTDAYLQVINKGSEWELRKGCDPRLLVAFIWRAVQLMKRLAEPNNDPLSGALNRRGMLQQVIREMSHVERHRTTTGCMFFDLNRLKLINDTYGHSFGDKVIVSVINTLTDHLRPTDVVCRPGGDEIIAFLFDIQEEDALKSAQSSCKAVAEKIIYLNDEEHSKGHVYASVSVGVSILKPEEVIGAVQDLPNGIRKREALMDILNRVIDIADKRMYVHKNAKK